ncbi:hypothetical protein [Candidatus Collinsella stercoripullorum]|uniref:hypothetical protein n=1 Tax=Candidatus Collinsella stercoripullorum TaxID=2838522 RepID=UPI0022E6BA03|nr:hypothetical protein [Candidatus Collinsella stercoripullorum]
MPRKRAKRQLIREVLVYCEGKTEKHYIDGLRQWARTLDLGARVKIKAVDVKGGGYGAILNMLRKEPDSNCVARVVLLDFDRYRGVQGEDAIFNQLVAYSKASMRKAVPCILVVSNASFEHALCLHDTGYHESGIAASFLLENWGYRNLNDCKSDERIWEKAHTGDRDHAHIAERMRGRKLVLTNKIEASRSKIDIKLKDVRFDVGCEHIFGTNLGDLFKVLCLS